MINRCWQWLTEQYFKTQTDGSGIRLIVLTVIIPLILMAEFFHWFR